MNWTTLFGFISLISGMVCVCIAIYLAPYRNKSTAKHLLILMLSVSIWFLGYGMEFLSSDLALKLWWVKFEYVGCSWVGLIIFKFVCTLTEKPYCLKKSTQLVLSIIPVLTIVFAMTNESHGLLWQQAHVESDSLIQGLLYKRGSAFWVYVAFSYGLIFWATFILIKDLVLSKGIYRKQLTIVLSGIMVPWFCNVLYLFGFQGIMNLDLTPFAFMISGILFAWGLLRYQFLNLLPLALEAVMDGMGDPVIVMDMNDRVMEINEACSKSFQIQAFSSGKKTASIMFPDLYRYIEVHRKQTPVEIEATFTINNIAKQWHLRVSPLLSKKKQNGWLIVLRDITGQKQAEDAIRASEEKHRTMLEASPTPIAYYSKKGEITYVNPAFTQVFGWEYSELKDTLFDDFIPKNQQQTAEDFIGKLYAHPAGKFNFVTQKYTKNKELLDVSINSAVYRNRAEKQSYIVVNYTDISRIKKVEQELRFARDYVRSIINSMPSILIGVDDREVVTQWNREAEKITGITAEQARGKAFFDIFPQLIGDLPNIAAAIQNQKVQRKEKGLLMINGKKFMIDITVYPITAENIPGAVIRMDDISERIKIEEMMVQSEKMMSVGGLAAGLAHEINNPLAGILQNTQVIQNRLSKPIPANIKVAEKYDIDLEHLKSYMEEREIFNMMSQVISVGKRAAKIIENMLSFSRKSDSKRSLYSLQNMMTSTLDLMKNDYSLKKEYDLNSIKIQSESEDDFPPIPCEKTKIQQVFFNVLKNGAEAMSEANVTAPMFVIRYSREQEMAVIEIRDNGPGIPDETRKRIFEPFFTTKEVGLGTGLGLSVSYFIIKENHNGEMTVESSPGKGTAFIIKLPF